MRQILNLPLISVIDYRASCFCCKKIIESGIGFVCSVCLSSKFEREFLEFEKVEFFFLNKKY